MNEKKIEKVVNELISENKSDVNIIIGKKGSGKTTYLTKKIKDTIKENIFFCSPVATFKKVNNILFLNDTVLLNTSFLQHEIKDSLLIFDDCKNYINPHPYEKNTLKIMNFVRLSRHYNNSMYFVFHSFEQVTRTLWTLSDRIILFKSFDNIEKFSKIFSNFENVRKKFHEVNSNKSDNYHQVIEL
ncbi:MAG: hypothetical protein Kow0068_20810 [Marinilabiliales bacterium]